MDSPEICFCVGVLAEMDDLGLSWDLLERIEDHDPVAHEEICSALVDRVPEHISQATIRRYSKLITHLRKPQRS